MHELQIVRIGNNCATHYVPSTSSPQQSSLLKKCLIFIFVTASDFNASYFCWKYLHTKRSWKTLQPTFCSFRFQQTLLASPQVSLLPSRSTQRRDRVFQSLLNEDWLSIIHLILFLRFFVRIWISTTFSKKNRLVRLLIVRKILFNAKFLNHIELYKHVKNQNTRITDLIQLK